MSRSVPVRALVRSEWTKFRSLRGVWACLGLYAAAVVVGAYSALTGGPVEDPRDAVATALVGFAPGQLALLVLGALVVTSEYRTGTVLSSLTAVPRRTRLLVSKTVVAAVWTAVLTALLALGCVAAIPVLTAGAPDVPLTEPVVLRPLAVQVVAAVSVVVLGVGLGTVVRRTAAAGVLGGLLVLVLPTITAAAASSVVAVTAPFWPSLRVGVDDVLLVATRGSLSLPAGGDVLLAGATAWPTGLVVNGAWALAVWVLGALTLERRDA